MMAIKYWTKEGCFEAIWFSEIPLAQLHRTDGPAIEYENNTCDWFQNGKLHRIEGPAVEDLYGARYWFRDGKPHRTDGPAIERSDGDREWRLDGKPHRIDGPALERPNGFRTWCLFGHSVTEEEHKSATAKGELYVKMRYG